MTPSSGPGSFTNCDRHHVMSGSRWQAGRIAWSVSVTGRAADRLETWGHEPLDEQACGERMHRLVYHVDDLLPPLCWG